MICAPGAGQGVKESWKLGSAKFEPVEAAYGRGGTKKLELGRIQAPENRNRSESRQITLAFLRARSPRPNPGPPVFFLAGGPGGSGIDMLKGMLRNGGDRLFDVMGGGDLIGIDQRGVGLSEPNLSSSTKIGHPVSEPGDRQKLLALLRQRCREEAARWRAKGVDLAGYTTAESADDIDAVRRALGYKSIILFGGSYGSHLALATIRRHGAHVARAMLIGPEGPDHTIKLPSYAESGLRRLAELTKADPKIGPLVPDLYGTLAKVLQRLEEKPVYVEVEGTRVGISKFDVQRLVAQAIGLVRGHADRVPAAVYEMAHGDFRQVAKEVLEDRRDGTIRSAMQMVMDSASGLSKGRAARIAKEAKTCLLADAVNFPFPHLAEAWGAPDLGPVFRGPLRSEVPVLFIVGDLDSRTPVANAEELMKDLPNSHLIVVGNLGHDTSLGHPDLRRAWSGFLAGKRVELKRIDAPKPRFQMPSLKPAK